MSLQVFLKKCLVCLFHAFFQALLEGRVQRVAAICNATLMHNIIQSLGMAGRFWPLHTQRTDTEESGVRSGGWGSRDAAAQRAVSQYVPLSVRAWPSRGAGKLAVEQPKSFP
jgi:hypothetical protein